MRELAFELGRLREHGHGGGATACVSGELSAAIEVAGREPARGRRAQLELGDDVERLQRETRWQRRRERAALERGVVFACARGGDTRAARLGHALEERHAAPSLPNAARSS